jgi:hypothetical protein
MIRRTFAASTFVAFIFIALSGLTAFALAASKPAENKAVTLVDQGTFAIFQGGQRVATENFTIRQYPDTSVTSSQFHAEATQSSGKLEQSSELTLFPDGSLSRYEWKEVAPVHSSLTVELRDQFLTMHIVAEGKSTDQPFFLTATAFVLDDYSFSSREVLLWRYLATACKTRANGDGCDLVRTQFAIVVPRRRTSSEVYVEFKGYEEMPFNGRPQHLRHFLIQTEGPDWHLWLDSEHKLLRISIPDTHTEILRQEK